MAAPKKILLIDDDAELVESNRMMLETLGYEVRSACDGSSGYDAATSFRPDLVILDVMMAYQTEGFDVARRIHATPELETTPILLVSGIVNEKELGSSLRPEMQSLPVRKVLGKPIDPRKLIREIEKLIHRDEDEQADER